MGRRFRIYFKGATYHVTARGNNHYPVLKHEEDKLLFLDSIYKCKLKTGFNLHGFVLMDNHAHLIIATSSISPSISKIMQIILLSFSVRYRERYKYSGYVWQGRFGSDVIDNDNYLRECLAYIHNNPVKAGIVSNPGQYRWSSYWVYEDSYAAHAATAYDPNILKTVDRWNNSGPFP